MIVLIKIMIMISAITPIMKTPMSMGVLLMTQTIISTILMSKIMTTSWMSMIMFLMLIGGLMVLFMYMSSIASNEKFSFNMKIIIALTILTTPLESLMMENQMEEHLNMFTNMDKLSMMKIYNKKTFMLTLFMFSYMLITMIVVNKIIKIHKGPMRSKYE